jgi:hypothetical protein
MSDSSATLSVILYKSKTLSNGDHPLMLRITKNRQRKYLSIGISCPLQLWDEKKCKPKRKHPQQLFIESIINKKIQQYRNAEVEAKHEGKSITASGLVEKVERPLRNVSILNFFIEVANRLKLAGQIKYQSLS